MDGGQESNQLNNSHNNTMGTNQVPIQPSVPPSIPIHAPYARPTFHPPYGVSHAIPPQLIPNDTHPINAHHHCPSNPLPSGHPPLHPCHSNSATMDWILQSDPYQPINQMDANTNTNYLSVVESTNDTRYATNQPDVPHDINKEIISIAPEFVAIIKSLKILDIIPDIITDSSLALESIEAVIADTTSMEASQVIQLDNDRTQSIHIYQVIKDSFNSNYYNNNHIKKQFISYPLASKAATVHPPGEPFPECIQAILKPPTKDRMLLVSVPWS